MRAFERTKELKGSLHKCCRLWLLYMVIPHMVSGSLSFAKDELDLEEVKCKRLMSSVANDYTRPAWDAENASQYSKAIGLLEKAVEKLKASSFKANEFEQERLYQLRNCFYSMAIDYSRSKNHSRAIELFLECDKLNNTMQRKSDVSYLACVADEYRLVKDFRKAELYCQKAIKLGQVNGNKIGIFLILSETYAEQKKFPLAEKTLQDFIAERSKLKKVNDVRTGRVWLRNLYREEKKTVEAQKIEHALNDRHCPVCGSEANVKGIVYGLTSGPVNGAHLGGCNFTETSPKWWCNKDKLEF